MLNTQGTQHEHCPAFNNPFSLDAMANSCERNINDVLSARQPPLEAQPQFH